MRVLCAGLSLALLAGCGGGKEDVACCAIEPKATCASELLKAGVTREQVAILTGPAETVCPSTACRKRRCAVSPPHGLRPAAQLMALGVWRRWRAAAAAGMRPRDGWLCPAARCRPEGCSACASGLAARGAKPNELWLLLREPDGACPNNGVDEARIREIIARDWDAAGCTQFIQDQMLHALNSGACGGDAG